MDKFVKIIGLFFILVVVLFSNVNFSKGQISSSFQTTASMTNNDNIVLTYICTFPDSNFNTKNILNLSININMDFSSSVWKNVTDISIQSIVIQFWAINGKNVHFIDNFGFKQYNISKSSNLSKFLIKSTNSDSIKNNPYDDSNSNITVNVYYDIDGFNLQQNQTYHSTYENSFSNQTGPRIVSELTSYNSLSIPSNFQSQINQNKVINTIFIYGIPVIIVLLLVTSIVFFKRRSNNN